MNPWWKRPSPGESKGGRSRRSGGSQAEPSRLTDTLNEADQISEIDGDLFEDERQQKKPRKRRRRRRSGRRGKKLVGLALCDVEALAHDLSTREQSLEETFAALWGDKTPKKMLAYAGSQADSRLCDDLSECGFQVANLDDDQIAAQMAVDAWALLEELHPADSVVLLADHPAVVPLAQRLLALDRQTFVHRSEDNPLAEICGLEVSRPERSEKRRSGRSEEEPEPADDPGDEGDRHQTAEDDGPRSDVSAEDESDREASDESPRRRSRGSRRGGRSRRGKRPERRPDLDPLEVLDQALRELVDRGPMMIWATLARQECLRQAPGFDETAFGYESFHQLLQAAAEQGRIELTHVEETDSWVISAWSPAA